VSILNGAVNVVGSYKNLPAGPYHPYCSDFLAIIAKLTFLSSEVGPARRQLRSRKLRSGFLQSEVKDMDDEPEADLKPVLDEARRKSTSPLDLSERLFRITGKSESAITIHLQQSKWGAVHVTRLQSKSADSCKVRTARTAGTSVTKLKLSFSVKEKRLTFFFDLGADEVTTRLELSFRVIDKICWKNQQLLVAMSHLSCT
jgi:hypothetical protein